MLKQSELNKRVSIKQNLKKNNEDIHKQIIDKQIRETKDVHGLQREREMLAHELDLHLKNEQKLKKERDDSFKHNQFEIMRQRQNQHVGKISGKNNMNRE